MTWTARLSRILIPLLATVTAILVGATVYLLIEEQRDRGALGGVEVAGPCRRFGPDNPECIRQANLIAAACAKHPRSLACQAISALADRRGGDARQTPSSGNQTSTPPSGGDTGGRDQGGGTGGGTTPGGSAPSPAPAPQTPTPPASPKAPVSVNLPVLPVQVCGPLAAVNC